MKLDTRRMKTSNIVCDLDGTLIDSHPGIRTSIQRACGEVMPCCNTQDLDIVIGPPIRQMLERALPQTPEDIIERIAQVYRRYYDNCDCLSYTAYGSVIETLRWFTDSGLSLYVLTNKPEFPTWRILAHMEISRLFRGVICIDSKAPPFTSKREAGAHLKALFHLPEGSTVLVGDGEDDMAVAHACGFRFVAATYGYGHNWNTTRADVTRITAFSELAELIQKWGGEA